MKVEVLKRAFASRVFTIEFAVRAAAFELPA